MYRFVLFFLLCIVLLPACMGTDASNTPESQGQSPTGTFLDPQDGAGEHGYKALDETCDQVSSGNYLDRFITPMFRSVVAKEQVVYLVDGSLLWVVSIENVENPVRLSLTRLPGHPLSVALSSAGNLIVAAGEAGLLSVDIHDPSNPVISSTIQLAGAALDVDVSGETAYVPMGLEGLAVIDIKESASMNQIGHIALPDFANDVDVEQGLAYVAACASLSIVDVSTVDSMKIFGTYWVPNGHAKAVHAVDGHLYIAGGEALFAFDASDPSMVYWQGFYDDPDVPGFYVNDVVIKNGVAYIAAGDESVRAVDVSTIWNTSVDTYLPPRDDGDPPQLNDSIELPPATIVIETITITEGDPIGVGVFGDLLFVLGNFRWVGERLLRIMDISNPDAMTDVGAYVQPNHFLGADFLNDHLVVHLENGEELLLDSKGNQMGSFTLPSPVQKAKQANGSLYMLAMDGFMYRWNEDSENLAHKITDWYTYDVTIGPLMGYGADPQMNGVRPFSLDGSFIGTIVEAVDAFPGYAHLLYVDKYIYAYDWAMGLLHVFQAKNPEYLKNVGVVDVGFCEMYDIADFYSGLKEARAMMVPGDDNLMLLCPYDENGGSSILELDLTDPVAPVVIGTHTLPELRYTDMAIDGSVVFAVGFDNNSYKSSLVTINEWQMNTVDWDGHANNISLTEDEIIVVDGDRGLLRFMRTPFELKKIDNSIYQTKGDAK